MANSIDGNVYYVDTTSTSLPSVRQIEGIKYIGSNSGTAVIKSLDAAKKLWQAAGADDKFDEVCIRCDSGISVELTNGAAVYIYAKVE